MTLQMTISQPQLIPNLELVHEHTVYKFVDGMLSNKIEFPSIEIVVKKRYQITHTPAKSHRTDYRDVRESEDQIAKIISS
jgi:hypothetical protein